MHHSGWRSCSLENEVANIWRNATGSVLQRWQREEPTDGGQCRKCSVILCRRCHAEKFEREWSEKTPRETAVGASVKMKAKEEQEPTGWSGLFVQSNEGETRLKCVRRGWLNYPPYPMAVLTPHFISCAMLTSRIIANSVERTTLKSSSTLLSRFFHSEAKFPQKKCVTVAFCVLE